MASPNDNSFLTVINVICHTLFCKCMFTLYYVTTMHNVQTNIKLLVNKRQPATTKVTKFKHVAVPGRNRTLFCCIFRPRYHIQSAIARNFECGNAVEIRNGIMFNFYPGLPHMVSGETTLLEL